MTTAKQKETSFAGSAARIVQEAVREDASVMDLAKIAGADPGLSLRLLALVNSPAFGGKSVKTVQQAASMLGIRGVRNLALSIIVSDLVPDGEGGKTLLENSLRRAVASRRIGGLVGIKDLDACFTLGLLLEVGLVSRAGEKFDDTVRVAKAPPEERCVLEQALGWPAHPQAGAALGKDLALPAEMLKAIAGHHDSSPPDEPFAKVAWAAERVAGVFESPRVEDSKRSALEALATIGVELSEDEDLFEQVRVGVEEAANGFQRDLGKQPSLDDLMRDANKSLVEMNAHYESLVRTLEKVVAEKQALTEDLEKANEELERLATTDALTQVPNKRALSLQLGRDLARADREQTDISLIVCDVDHFKKFNDTYGHAVGDDVLKAVAQALKGAIRTSDFVARYGGEEFVAVLPATGEEGALILAERLREAITLATVEHPDGPLQVTASFGVASTHGPGCKEKAEALFEAADKSLYKAKEAGRNCVRAAAA